MHFVVAWYLSITVIASPIEDTQTEMPISNTRFHLTLLFKEPVRISAQTVYCQKLNFLLNVFVADSMNLSLLVFMQLFSKVAVFDARRTCAKTEANMK